MKIILTRAMLFLLVGPVHYNGQVDAGCAVAPGLNGVVDIPNDWTQIPFQ